MLKNDRSLKTLADDYIQQINEINFRYVHGDMFIHIESCYALYQLRIFLEKFNNDYSELNQDHLDLFFDFFKKRYEIIEDTDAGYVNNKHSSANKIYLDLACSLTEKSRKNNLNITDHIQLLMPQQNFIYNKNNEEKLKQYIYDILYKDNEESEQLKLILSNLKTTEKQFAKELAGDITQIKNSIFLELKKIKNDESHLFSLYIENIQSMLGIVDYLNSIDRSYRLIDLKTIRPFISWLEERWKWINKTKASYNSKEHTQFNDYARNLANFIVLTSYQTLFSNRDPEKLLMKFKEKEPIADDEGKLLEKAIVKRVNSFNHLINMMLWVPPKQWQNVMKLFEYQDLIKLAAPNMNEGEDFTKFFKKNNLFNRSEIHNKAVLFVFLEIYAKKRQAGNKYNTLFAPLFNNVIYIPSREEKLKTVEHIKNTYLVKNKPLSQYLTDLDDPLSDLYQYKNVITDGKFKKYVKQIKNSLNISNEFHEEPNNRIII